MKVSEIFPSKYVSASDLDDPIKVTIKGMKKEEVGETRESLPILLFENHDKGLVLNKTNTKKIASIHGGETDNWNGKSIMLVKAYTSYKGEEVECIRVKEAPESISM